MSYCYSLYSVVQIIKSAQVSVCARCYKLRPQFSVDFDETLYRPLGPKTKVRQNSMVFEILAAIFFTCYLFGAAMKFN